MNVASNTAGAPLSSAVFVAATRSAPAWCGRSIKTPPGYRARAASPTWRPWSKRSCSTLSGCSSGASRSCTSHQSFLWHWRPEVKRDLERRWVAAGSRGSPVIAFNLPLCVAGRVGRECGTDGRFRGIGLLSAAGKEDSHDPPRRPQEDERQPRALGLGRYLLDDADDAAEV